MINRDEDLDPVWITREGTTMKIKEMDRGHLVNTVNMMAKKLLTNYDSRGAAYLDCLNEELNRRIAKEKLKDLFEI